MHRVKTWARTKAHGATPLSKPSSAAAARQQQARPSQPKAPLSTHEAGVIKAAVPGDPTGALPHTNSQLAPVAEQDNGAITAAAAAGNEKAAGVEEPKANIGVRFYRVLKNVLLSSWFNVLLVFVPVGIAAHFANLSPGVVFAMNAIAIVPLAGLLAHATESVASKLGDTIGALMNVTFGNAVELIIFIIALVKNEIRIVQAALLGSILANLLLILGMCFLFGGLRFREQIYNSTVTQMSACLLSLSVTSLLLPTAFHASFNDLPTADAKVLQVSRGVSVILLLVYFLYLLFQLNSHAYMYESTPQEVIERETRPGPAAQYFESSSSSDDSSSSSDTDDSNDSGGTRNKIRRAMKSMTKRKDSSPAAKTETIEGEDVIEEEGEASPSEPAIKPVKKSATEPMDQSDGANPMIDPDAVDEADGEREERRERRRRRKHHHKRQREAGALAEGEQLQQTTSANGADTSKRVDFAAEPDLEAQTPAKPKPFALRAIRPTIAKRISQNVFVAPPPQEQYTGRQQQSSSTSNNNPGLRRANSLPVDNRRYRVGPGELPPIVPVHVTTKPRVQSASDDPNHDEKPTENISRTSAVLLLLGSTGLVALCAEFMVDSINEVVAQNSAISEAFIGLILLPIVGNAAEHVTAVTVALKNKMDLAIGVAVGSSIQIALFVTPLVVILGWIMNKEMSLFFTIFETVSLFVSAFIVNFLVLDGRSNYLEGALLCAAYVIIGTAAFFYPDSADASDIGGGSNDTATAGAKMLVRGLGQIVKLW